MWSRFFGNRYLRLRLPKQVGPLKVAKLTGFCKLLLRNLYVEQIFRKSVPGALLISSGREHRIFIGYFICESLSAHFTQDAHCDPPLDLLPAKATAPVPAVAPTVPPKSLPLAFAAAAPFAAMLSLSAVWPVAGHRPQYYMCTF